MSGIVLLLVYIYTIMAILLMISVLRHPDKLRGAPSHEIALAIILWPVLSIIALAFHVYDKFYHR